MRRMRDGESMVIDVRPDEEFGAGHLAGALSIPLEELERRLDHLPKDREILAYCRGPHCILSVEAVQLLRSRGFCAHRVDLGPAAFTDSGFPIIVQ
ncbi:MAG: rhodanese-like domain-containing protein [Opitutales bacterium]